MKSNLKPSREVLAEYSKEVERETLHVRVYREGPHEYLCERDLVIDNRKLSAQACPFKTLGQLKSFLIADEHYAAMRSEAERMLARLAAEIDGQYDLGCNLQSLDQVLEWIGKIKECKNESEVAAILRLLVRFFGLQWYVFVSLRPDDVSRESYRYLIGCQRRWCQIYNARRWYMNDPFIQHAMWNSTPIFGSEIVPQTAGQVELLAAARTHGFRSGIVVPAHSGTKGRIGVLYLGCDSEPAELEPRLSQYTPILRSIAMELFDWWQVRIEAEVSSQLQFSDVDLKLLHHVHDGFSTQELGSLLGLTASQINNRFRRINQTLKVNSRKQAASRARDLGLLRQP